MALEQRAEVEKDPHEAKWETGAVEQGRFQRNIYLRVVGIWQRRHREAASWPQYRREEEGVRGPPEPARPPIGTRGQPLVSSLADDDTVNDAPTPLPGQGCSAGFVTSRELRESVATYVLLRCG